MASVKACLFVSVCVSSLIADTVSLQEILNHASHNAKTLVQKQLDAKIESKNLKSAKSAYYPTLGFVYNGEYNQALDGSSLTSEYVGGLTISSQTRYQSSMAFQLNYDLYNFGATSKQVSIAAAEVDIKKIDWCSEEKKLYEQILEHYASARKATVEKNYTMQMLEVRKKLYEMKKRLYDAGQYSKVDLGDEAISVIGIERDIENAQMQYKDDLIKISQLSYMQLSDDVQLLAMDDDNKDDLTKEYEDTAEAKVLTRRIAQKRDEISMQFRQELPSLSLYSNYYLYSTDPSEYDYTISHINKKSWNVGFAIRYNIFDGFKESSKQERLKLELQHLQEEFYDGKHNYEHETKSKTTRMDELDTLKQKEEHLLEENYKKREMLSRLREEQKVDALTQLNAEYELLQHTLNIQTRKIDAAYERASLNILHRGMDQCSPH
ncbi:TolC family protein [bacterium]|nr:TolC family protein [bacterium]MBU1883432.1 TolC family protein [bacterium]